MCDEQADNIGDLVPDQTMIFRGCSRKNFLTPTRDGVQPQAFLKDGRNHKDGLSLSLSAIDSVKYLNKNHGVIVIRVGDIHALNRGLEVRRDLLDPQHVLIRNLPCMDRSMEERAHAEAVAAELAFRATVAHSAPIAISEDNTPSP